MCSKNAIEVVIPSSFLDENLKKFGGLYTAQKPWNADNCYALTNTHDRRIWFDNTLLTAYLGERHEYDSLEGTCTPNIYDVNVFTISSNSKTRYEMNTNSWAQSIQKTSFWMSNYKNLAPQNSQMKAKCADPFSLALEQSTSAPRSAGAKNSDDHAMLVFASLLGLFLMITVLIAILMICSKNKETKERRRLHKQKQVVERKSGKLRL